MSPELTGALIALLVPVCFGTGSVLVRVGLVEIPSNTGNFISLVSGWIVMVTVALVLFPSDLVSVTVAGFAGLALIGFINFPIGRFLNFMSIQRLGVVRANPILAASPIISAFEGVVFLGEDINWVVGLGTVLAVAGVITVVTGEVTARGGASVGAPPPSAPNTKPAMGVRGWLASRPKLIGYFAAVGGALAYGTVPALGRVAVTEIAAPLAAAVYTTLFGFLIMGAFVVKRLPGDLRRASRRSTLFVALGGLSMAMGVSMLYLALSKAPVVVVSPMFALTSLVGLILAHFFLRRLERITLLLIVGTVLVVMGVAAVIVGVEVQ